MYESYINKIEVVGKLRNLKPGTIRTYQKNVSDFLKFMDKNPEILPANMLTFYRAGHNALYNMLLATQIEYDNRNNRQYQQRHQRTIIFCTIRSH